MLFPQGGVSRRGIRGTVCEEDLRGCDSIARMPKRVVNKRAPTSARRATRVRAARKPAAKKPAAKKPAAKKSAATKPAATKPAAKKPAAKRPATKRPVNKAVDEVFWSLIDRVKQASDGDLEVAIEALRAELAVLDDTTLVEVEAAFCLAMQRAYDWNVWAAANVIHGGCSDDTFWDFRTGLVALGREVYEAALRDPETLAAIEDVESLTLSEGFQYVPEKVLESRGLVSTGGGHGMKREPTGTRWVDEAELEKRFPKLTARFG